MGRKRFVVEKRHLENAKLAKRGKKSAPETVHQFKEPKFEIFQNEAGEWMLRFEKSDGAFPATDVEVALWLKLKRLEEDKDK